MTKPMGPLPEARWLWKTGDRPYDDAYSTLQMMDYAAQEVAAERERWAGVEQYLEAAASGSMSRNNSEELAAELLAQIRAKDKA